MMSFHSCSFGGYGLVIIPEDRFIDIRKWTAKGKTHILEYISLKKQSVVIYNTKRTVQKIRIGGKIIQCSSEKPSMIYLDKKSDEESNKFYSKNFMKGPFIKWEMKGLPY